MACRAVAVSRAAKASVAVRTTHRPSRAVVACRAQVEQKPAKVPSFGKADLVNEIMARLDEDTKLKKKDVDAVVSLVLDVVTDKVAQGTRVSVPGFGSFEARHRQARAGRNPKTGEPLDIPAKTVPAFSAGKGFKDKVAAGGK